MRSWIIEEVKNSLNFRDKDNKPNYTTVVGLLFQDEKDFLKSINIDVKKLSTTYNLLIFKNNFNGSSHIY